MNDNVKSSDSAEPDAEAATETDKAVETNDVDKVPETKDIVETVDKSTEPPVADKSADKPPEKAAEKPVKRSRFAGFIAFIALIVALVAVGASAWLYRQLEEVKTAADTRASQQLAEIRSLDVSPQLSELVTQIDELKAERLQAQQISEQRIDEIKSAVGVLQETGQRGDRDWVIAETRYLLKMALHRIALAGDLDSAAAATRAADEQLHSLSDVRLLPVREALAEEIAALRGTPKPDVEGKVFALIQLARRSNSLPVVHSRPVLIDEPAEPEPVPSEAPNNNEPGFQAAVMKWVDRFVVVKPAPGKSDAQQPLYLADVAALEDALDSRAALQLALQKAQIAVLRRDQKDYLAALSSAKTLLVEDFDGQHELVQRFEQDLQQLEQSAVTPQVSGIGGALKLLNHIVAELEGES